MSKKTRKMIEKIDSVKAEKNWLKTGDYRKEEKVYGKAKKSVDLEKVRAITKLCSECDRNYRYCDICLEVFGEVI